MSVSHKKKGKRRKKTTLRHVIIKLLKNNNKEKAELAHGLMVTGARSHMADYSSNPSRGCLKDSQTRVCTCRRSQQNEELDGRKLQCDHAPLRGAFPLSLLLLSLASAHILCQFNKTTTLIIKSSKKRDARYRRTKMRIPGASKWHSG